MKDSFSARDYENTYEKEIGSFAITPVHGHALELLEIKKGDSVLDVGCAEGELIKMVLEREAKGTGMDYSEKAVEAARRNVPGAVFMVGDARKLPFPDGTFDKIACLGVIGYLNELDLISFFNEADRVMKLNGSLVIRTSPPLAKVGAFLLKLRKPNYSSRAKTYSPLKLKKMLREAGFSIEKVSKSMDLEASRSSSLKFKLAAPFFNQLWITAKKIR